MTQLTTGSADDPAAGKLAGRLTMLLVALLWSTSGLFAKAPIFDAWPEAYRGSLLAFWRSACAALVLLPTIRRPRYRTYLIPLTICFALMNVTYLTSMTRSTAANAIWLQNMAPWWVFLLSVLLFHEPVVRRDLIPLAFAMLGVGTILSFEIRGQAPFGAICGAASGVFYAAVVVLMRQLRSENSSWIVALSHTVTTAVLLPWVLQIGYAPSFEQLLALAAFGTVQMAIPYLLLIRALRSISSQEAVAIGLVEPVLLPLWVWLIWGEVPAWWTIVGAALILAGLLLRYVVCELLFPRKTPQNPRAKTPLARLRERGRG